MLRDSMASREIAAYGAVCLTRDAERCELTVRGDAVELAASSLSALRHLMPFGLRALRNRLPQALEHLKLRVDLRVREHLIARIGPHATPGRVSRLLGFESVQILPINLLRAKLWL